jgi:hypothetical protein
MSTAGAGGFWQFMPETGKRYKLQINGDIDERFHLEKSTEAACIYLNFLYDKFGSWTLAAAAYNRGEGGIVKAISDQKVKNFYDLYLNKETYAYMFRILSFKQIFSNPELYGPALDSSNYYYPEKIKYVNVTETIMDLPEWCLNKGINYKTLRNLNPWILKYHLHVKDGQSIQIALPT